MGLRDQRLLHGEKCTAVLLPEKRSPTSLNQRKALLCCKDKEGKRCLMESCGPKLMNVLHFPSHSHTQ